MTFVQGDCMSIRHSVIWLDEWIRRKMLERIEWDESIKCKIINGLLRAILRQIDMTHDQWDLIKSMAMRWCTICGIHCSGMSVYDQYSNRMPRLFFFMYKNLIGNISDWNASSGVNLKKKKWWRLTMLQRWLIRHGTCDIL